VIESAPDGVILHVRVIPRSGKSGLAGTREDAFLVRVNAPPVEGAANKELIEVLSKTLDVPKRAIAIVSGAQSREKRVQVRGLHVNAARARLIPGATTKPAG
jgi:uncharacterized protein (TIGR00251 family)